MCYISGNRSQLRGKTRLYWEGGGGDVRGTTFSLTLVGGVGVPSRGMTGCSGLRVWGWSYVGSLGW